MMKRAMSLIGVLLQTGDTPDCSKLRERMLRQTEAYLEYHWGRTEPGWLRRPPLQEGSRNFRRALRGTAHTAKPRM